MKKIMISIRLDSETLTWFREHYSKGYQSKINEILTLYQRENLWNEQRLLGRAQEIFRQFYARCFWHLNKDLKISRTHLPLIRENLRKYGGREGYELAAELTKAND